MRTLPSAALPAALLAAFALPAAAQDPPIIQAERARGIMTGGIGVEWIVDVTTAGEEERKAKFSCISQGGRISAEVLEPADARGRRYLAESGGAMWFWRPGLSRPVSVSRRQRLTGDAAIGDIASTSFVDGYRIESSEETELEGEAATVFTLRATSLGDTYHTIRYWVVKNGNLGKKAEFFARGGEMIRSASMEYGNRVEGRPFLSRMVIRDSGRTIDLRYSEVQFGEYPASLFTLESLSSQ